MDRDEMVKEVSAELTCIREQAVALTKLAESLSMALRADAAFNAVEETKRALTGMKETKESIEKVRKVLKLRLQKRLQEV